MEFKCSCCGKTLGIYDSYFIITIENKVICYDCVRQNKDTYKECRTCGKYFINNGESYCPDCIDKIFKTPLNAYSTKLTGIFDNKNKISKCLNNRYYGLEMEFNNINPKIMQVLLNDEYKNHKVYGKSDASINSGVEVVTVPMDRYSVNTFLDRIKVKLGLLDNHLTSSNAGLHIHVSRNSIPKEVITKLAILFNYKAKDNDTNALYYLCGRPSKNIGSDGYYRAGWYNNKLRYITRDSRGHSVAFNNANTDTVEFRIFKSINDTEVLKMYVDIVDSAIDFCSKNGFSMININNFMCYLGLTTKNDLIKSRLKYIIENFDTGKKVVPNIVGIFNVIEELLNDKVKDYNELESKLKANETLYKKIKEILTKDIIKGEVKCV